ncbi:hypothetical protein GPECTOR_43g890 [Gonium pectorale]|uniref:Uncharacterized protein n=1 Tax=Gonium pectorale TaxID=33097 RepID=A0A150G9D3_GONPE|nr:hypothetical protein GPECTOR_43g890 [Gonium pectorale]|eukprot:KXZ46454.1 hypothetical protein GPECTOR_43g890 [Gonium pectorale]
MWRCGRLQQQLSTSLAASQELQAAKVALERNLAERSRAVSQLYEQYNRVQRSAEEAKQEAQELQDALSEANARYDDLYMELHTAHDRIQQLQQQQQQSGHNSHPWGRAAAAHSHAARNGGTGEVQPPRAHGQLPPLSRVDASRLRPDADHSVGFGVAELRGQVAEFKACLQRTVKLLLQPPARGRLPCAAQQLLAPALEAAAGGGAAAGTAGAGAVLAASLNVNIAWEAACNLLAHRLLAELRAVAWEDPLAALGTGFGIGFGFGGHGTTPPLLAPTPGERNQAALLRSEVAHRLYDTVRCAVVAAEEGEEEAGGAFAGGRGRSDVEAAAARLAAHLAAALTGQCAHCVAHRQAQPRPQPQSQPQCLLSHDVASVAHALRPLALRSLQLGLFVSAAHPLWRLRVTPLVTAETGSTAVPLVPGLQVQEAAVPVAFNPQAAATSPPIAVGAPSPLLQLPPPVVLCSLAPGVVYDSEPHGAYGANALAAAVAAGGGGGGRAVVQAEPVMVLRWLAPQVAAAPARADPPTDGQGGGTRISAASRTVEPKTTGLELTGGTGADSSCAVAVGGATSGGLAASSGDGNGACSSGGSGSFCGSSDEDRPVVGRRSAISEPSGAADQPGDQSVRPPDGASTARGDLRAPASASGPFEAPAYKGA